MTLKDAQEMIEKKAKEFQEEQWQSGGESRASCKIS
jgi:hypothetical protein